jgi:hypothetical protein
MKAGIYNDLDEAVYHRDSALSASGAKRLLPPNCPALFKHDRDNGGRPNKRAFDLGHAAHAAVLGVGLELVVVDADNWMTKAAKAERDAAYAEGKCPILAKEKAAVDAMAEAIRRDPIASALLDPEHGRPEVFASLALGRARVDEACSVFRECTETGIWPGYSSEIELIAPPAWLAALYGLDDMEMVA